METLTGFFAKTSGPQLSSIYEHKTYQFLPKTVKFCFKLASYDSSSMMQYYASLHQLSLLPAKKVIYCLPISNSEGGTGTKTADINNSVRVKFQLQKECPFGDRFLIVGDDPILGSWNPSEAIPFNWSEGHIWSLLLELPVAKSIQYKFLLKKSTGEVLWQPGPDRSLQAWETKNVIGVTEEWDNAEAQKISEEQQVTAENEEPLNKTLVEPSALNSTEKNITSVSRHAGDLGSDENARTEDEKGAHLKENPSSGIVKKSRSSDRKATKIEVPMRKYIETQAKADKNSAVIEEGNLVTTDEGPVLVPGLTLLVSSEEALAKETQVCSG